VLPGSDPPEGHGGRFAGMGERGKGEGEGPRQRQDGHPGLGREGPSHRFGQQPGAGDQEGEHEGQGGRCEEG
jgi:hypothetical protein